MAITESVIKDIQELQKLRAISAKKAAKCIAYVNANEAEIEGYDDNGMRVSEITDLVRDLSSL